MGRTTNLRTSLIMAVFLMTMACTAATADQWDITVPDAGFDDYVLSPGGHIHIVDPAYTGPWKSHVVGVEGAWIGNGYWAANGWPQELEARSGDNIAYGDEDLIYQILDETFIEGVTYTLSVWVGQPWAEAIAWSLYFTEEDYTNNLIETSGSAPLSWAQVSLVYTATAADAGKKIGIKMRGDYDVSFEDVTLSCDAPPPPRIATNPSPADGARGVDINVTLGWLLGDGAVSHDVYFGTNFDEVHDGTGGTFKGNQTETTYPLAGLEMGTTYYWRIDEVNDANTWKGDIWSFTTTRKVYYVDAYVEGANDGSSWDDAYNNLQDALVVAIPGDEIRVAQGTYSPEGPLPDIRQASNPNPADGATGVSRTAYLSWTAGSDATSHDVYFGTTSPPPFMQNQTGTTFDPGTMAYITTYFWRIDEVRDDSKIKGTVWSFMTMMSPPSLGDSIEQATAATAGDRTATFQLINGVAIYGGYAGAGAQDPNARDIELYETILSGDIGILGDISDNSYHVVTGSGTDEMAVLDGFTITAGNADLSPYYYGGGIYNLSGSPTVTNCTFNGNKAYYGGGMYNEDNSSPTATNCTFNNNTAIYGGGMYNRDSSSPTVTNCTFSGNSANSNGGGMFNNYSSSPTVTNCMFSNNSANSNGGGMFNRDSSSPTIVNCTITGNSAGDYGGGMYNEDNSSPTITNCTFSENSAGRDGGGMENRYNSSPTVTNCNFSGNSAIGNDGGAMNNNNSNPTITNCTFSENSAYDWGGAVRNIYSSSPTLTNCVFIGNLADDGGGMYNYSSSSPTVTNCTFIGNRAEFGGGMNSNQSSSPTVTNCTFIGNSAGIRGGGMNNTSSNSTVANCTFIGNRAEFGGGMSNDYSGTMTVSNCIVWGNTAPSGPQIYIDETSTSNVSYSAVEEGWEGEGNINGYPFFAEPGYWDVNGTPEDANDDTWIDGDYHLKSEAGRWDANSESWVEDIVTSPCIDAGDPNSDWSAELWPHGKIINMGAYGGTREASMSLSDAGNIANLDAVGTVDYNDMALLTGKWLYEDVLLREDLNRDGIVNCTDFAIFANNWRILLVKARNPNPPDGAVNIGVNDNLSWTAAIGAESHDVYFGTSNPPPFVHNQTATIFEPGTMAELDMYYWRIDEVSDYWTITGSTWSFTTEVQPP